jgi:hypothetical protein
MLATHPLMEVLRHSVAFPSPGAGLMRHPSADDLDAAQQLIESARGDRQGTIVATAQRDQPYVELGSTRSLSVGRVSENDHFDTPMTEETNSLGQVCRYVYVWSGVSLFIACCMHVPMDFN